jgi:DNA-binding winged helix-turn-helix (wHTH) protein
MHGQSGKSILVRRLPFATFAPSAAPRRSPYALGSRALGLLELLVENAGEVVTKQQLTTTIWNSTWVVESNLRVNIAALRRVQGDGRDGRRYIVTVPGRGYRFVEPIVSAPVAPRLIGRSETLKEVTAQLATHRLVTITGPSGIGKTSVTLAVAEKWAASHPDLMVVIDLATVKDAAHLWTAVSKAIGARRRTRSRRSSDQFGREHILLCSTIANTSSEPQRSFQRRS